MSAPRNARFVVNHEISMLMQLIPELLNNNAQGSVSREQMVFVKTSHLNGQLAIWLHNADQTLHAWLVHGTGGGEHYVAWFSSPGFMNYRGQPMYERSQGWYGQISPDQSRDLSAIFLNTSEALKAMEAFVLRNEYPANVIEPPEQITGQVVFNDINDKQKYESKNT